VHLVGFIIRIFLKKFSAPWRKWMSYYVCYWQLFFCTNFMEIRKDTELQVMVKIRGLGGVPRLRKRSVVSQGFCFLCICCISEADAHAKCPKTCKFSHCFFTSRLFNPTRMSCISEADAHAKCPKTCKFSHCFIVRYVIYNNMHTCRTVEWHQQYIW